ncbi:exodeoxyribonuclease V subunit gamma [Vibrio sp. PP-XX7]
MGELGRDHLYLLSQVDCEEHEFFIEMPCDSLLHRIQRDILHLEEHQDDGRLDTSEHKQSIDPDDRSLSLHVCHSAMREVEAARGALIEFILIRIVKGMRPRDIIVMVADINAYGPAIEAVFGNAPSDRLYSIFDFGSPGRMRILSCMRFIRIIDFPAHVVWLLSYWVTPKFTIMARFDISEAEFKQAQLWVPESRHSLGTG